MPRHARIHYLSLRSSLVNLPISLYGPLLERGVRPQGLAVHLTLVVSPVSKISAKATMTGDGAIKKEAYVGWTGMASASSLAHFNASGSSGERGLETVEIDPQFAGSLGFAEGDTVEIGLLHDLGYATTVATEPLTADDWEIIELHASHVESTLLSQVRVALVGQEIDVWVLNRTRVRLRVVSLEPSRSGKALLLTTSTEVSIAPKTRSQARSNALPSGPATSINTKTTTSGKTKGTTTSTTDASQKEENDGGHEKITRKFRIIPARVLPPFTPPTPATDDSSIAAIAIVSKTTLRLIHFNDPSKPSEDWIEAKSWRATVRRLLPPLDPTQEQKNATVVTVPVPHVFNPGDPETSSKMSTSAAGVASVASNEILVTWSPDIPVPNGLAVFHGSVGGIEDWDLVRMDFIEEYNKPIESEQKEDSRPYHVSRGSVPKLAGVKDILDKISDFCVSTFTVHASLARVRGVPGLLVTGRAGSGKTSILNAAARALQENDRTYAYTLYVDLSRYTESPVSKIKSLLRYWFEKAQWHRPSVIIMDNMDELMSAEKEHTDSFRSRHITELFIREYSSSMRTAAPNAKAMILLASAKSKQALHPNLHLLHTFQEVIHLKPPNKESRKEASPILMQIVKGHLHASDLIEDPASPLNYTVLAMDTEGYAATDIKDLVARAVHQAAIRVAKHEHEEGFQPTLRQDDFIKAQADFVPVNLRDVKLHKSEVRWADIGGLKETKRVLRETLEWPTKYAPIFAQSPLRLRQGLMLYGYPGCGKTLLASAIAKECGLNFISVKGPELLNKYIGASEQSVRELFERASAAKPCVLFFDEFDSIAPKRGHDSTGVTDRVVNQMLTQLDGVEGLDGVYVLAATSRPDLIDSALLRPGRLDKSLLCPMPDLEDRKEILEAVGRKVSLAPSVDLSIIAQETEGYSGADLQALLYNANLEAIHETLADVSSGPGKSRVRDTEVDEPTEEIQVIKLCGPDQETEKVTSQAEKDAVQRQLRRILANSRQTTKRKEEKPETVPMQKREVTEDHILRVLKKTRPSVPPEERRRLDRVYNAFISDRSGELPVPPDAGGVGHRVTLM